VSEVEKSGSAQFKWTQGTHKATPPPGFDDYFGAGPLYRFIDYDGMNAFDILQRIRDFPEGTSAEDTMRLLMGEDPGNTAHSVRHALQVLIDKLDDDKEIEVRLVLPLGSLVRCLYHAGRPRIFRRSVHCREPHTGGTTSMDARWEAEKDQGGCCFLPS
jgi:hypothetical protein